MQTVAAASSTTMRLLLVWAALGGAKLVDVLDKLGNDNSSWFHALTDADTAAALSPLARAGLPAQWAAGVGDARESLAKRGRPKCPNDGGRGASRTGSLRLAFEEEVGECVLDCTNFPGGTGQPDSTGKECECQADKVLNGEKKRFNLAKRS